MKVGKYKLSETQIANLGLFIIFLFSMYSLQVQSFQNMFMVSFATYFLFRYRKTKDLKSLRIDLEPLHDGMLKLFFYSALTIITFQMITVFLIVPQLVKISPTYANYVNALTDKHSKMDFFSAQVLVIILAPWLEEIFFRGFLQRIFGKIHFSFGICLSALIFASMHPNVLGALVIGLVHGILAYKTRSLVIPMLSHFANNLGASLPVDTTDTGRLFSEQIQDVNAEYAWSLGICLVTTYTLCGLLLNLILEMKRKKAEKSHAFSPSDSSDEALQGLATP